MLQTKDLSASQNLLFWRFYVIDATKTRAHGKFIKFKYTLLLNTHLWFVFVNVNLIDSSFKNYSLPWILIFLYISKLFCLPDHKFTGFMASRDFMVTQSFIVRDKPTTCTFPSIDFGYNKASKTTDDRNYVIDFGCYFQSNTHWDSTQLTIKIFVMDCYCHWSLKAQLSTLLKKTRHTNSYNLTFKEL